MKYNFLVTLCVASISLASYASEPSAFGAGNLGVPDPYGLTPSEKVILQNKTKLHKVLIKSNNQANEVDSLRERLDGLQTIIETLSIKAHNNRVNIEKLNNKNQKALEGSSEYQKRLAEATQSNSKEIELLKSNVAKMFQIVNDINSSYVTRADYNYLVNNINSLKAIVVKGMKSKYSKKSPLDSMSKSDIAKRAKKYYDKKYYSDAIKYYTYLISKNYKPAYAHYMIGEMKFKRKNYGEAISYFKKSASLYKKASYMPRLMLHTAISMQRTGDKRHAKVFYEAIIAKYANSAEAKKAKKYLSLMK